jgi:HK97 family phage portal protein
MGLLQRLGLVKPKAAEGEYRPGPYLIEGGWLSATAGKAWNWWQLGYSLQSGCGASAIVEACVGAYSQTVAMCPGDHWRSTGDGGRERVTTSALTRILRRPNDYQSISDFLLNLVRSLYYDGNAYALAIRNDRTEVRELHLMHPRQSSPRVAEDGSVFYHLGGNEIVDHRFGPGLIVPARDVLHVRLQTPRHPLKGETPIMAAALDVAASNAMLQQQIAFFDNESRPSYVLTTDQVLTLEQARDLRTAWEAQTKGVSAGGTPILTAGLKAVTVTSSARDSQLAETMKMTNENVALVMRVPLQILGLGGTPYASTELLMQSWYASGLGFALNHIEEAFGQLFGLRGVPDEYVEFDMRALLRPAYKDRIEALARSVQGGLHSPDEGRAELELPKVPGGHGKEPRVQQQVVPLSFWEKSLEAASAPAAPAEPVPALPPPDEQEEEAAEDAERNSPDAILQRLYAPDARLH